MSLIGKMFQWFSHLLCEDDEYYTVKVAQGDSLWELAKDMTGEGDRWQELVAANPGRAFDKDYTLQIGEELRIPKDWAE